MLCPRLHVIQFALSLVLGLHFFYPTPHRIGPHHHSHHNHHSHRRRSTTTSALQVLSFFNIDRHFQFEALRLSAPSSTYALTDWLPEHRYCIPIIEQQYK